MGQYAELKNRQPELIESFVALSNEDYEKSINELGLQGKQIYSYANGYLYGTKEGLQKFDDFLNDRQKEIREKCTPQEIYNYEFTNHECAYTGSDEEALKIVAYYFNEDEIASIKRHGHEFYEC